jgi:hypothetical protein
MGFVSGSQLQGDGVGGVNLEEVVDAAAELGAL